MTQQDEKPKHSPLPWNYAINEDGNQWLVCDRDDLVVARVPSYREPEDRADAEFIVQAVNSHEEIVAALKGLSLGTCWCGMAIGNPMYRDHSPQCVAARAALAKAGTLT